MSKQSPAHFVTPLSNDMRDELAAAVEVAKGALPDDSPNGTVDAEETLDWLSRALIGRHPDRGMDVWYRTGVLKAVLPEVHALVGFGDAIRHKDVWAHTRQVVRQCPDRLALRWAALLHDIGKVATRRFTDNGQVTFIGHPEVGARMFDQIARRLPFPQSARKRIRFLIAGHLRAASYIDDWTESAVRRFYKETDVYLTDLLDLSRADITSKYEEKVRSGLEQISCLARRIVAVKHLDDKPKSLPTGLGDHIIREFNITPGPQLGRVMALLKARVDDGTLPRQAPVAMYLTYLKDDLFAE